MAAITDVDLVGAVILGLVDMSGTRHAAVLRMRLGVDDSPPLTLASIGQELGVTRERVRQLEVKALPRLKRTILASPVGAELVRQLTETLQPKGPGYEDRVLAATAVLCPDWPARTGRRIVMVLAGRLIQEVLDDKRSLGSDADRAQGQASAAQRPAGRRSDGRRSDVDGRPPARDSPTGATLYEAVSVRFGVKVDGRNGRFALPGWFPTGPAVSPCPVCGLSLEGFRRPYVTKAGVQYHYWGLVCLRCRRCWVPADLDDTQRQDVYHSSEHRPQNDHPEP